MSLTRQIIVESLKEQDVDEAKVLSLRGKGLKDLSELHICSSLQKIDLDNNQLETLDGIERCACITNLVASANQIKSVGNALKGLRLLTVLNLTRNKLQKIDGIEESDKLCALIASENEITEIPDFKHNPLINTLVLSSNHISCITLSTIPIHLTKLNLSHNQIKEIPDLSGLKELQQLFLNDNQIESIPESIKTLSNLTLFEIANNNLSTKEAIEPVFALKLHSFSMQKNPIFESNAEEIKALVMEKMPELVILNSKRLKPKKSHYPEDHEMYLVKKEKTEKILKEKYGGNYQERKVINKQKKKEEKENENKEEQSEQKTESKIKPESRNEKRPDFQKPKGESKPKIEKKQKQSDAKPNNDKKESRPKPQFQKKEEPNPLKKQKETKPKGKSPSFNKKEAKKSESVPKGGGKKASNDPFFITE